MKYLILVMVFGVLISACAPAAAPATQQPEAVMVQQTIDGVVAHYGCQAPGAYLTTVDTSTNLWTAGYFTTDSQNTKVTYGPEKVTVVPK
jgi:hypothetical protein